MAEVAVAELEAVGTGNVGVIVPSSMVDVVTGGLERAGVTFGSATRNGLDERITVVPIGLAKGLELDASVVVEPAAIVEQEAQGLRALYVALTRATKRLAIVHARPLPDYLLRVTRRPSGFLASTSAHIALDDARIDRRSGRHEDAGAGECADAHGAAFDLDGRRPVRGRRGDRAVAPGQHVGLLEELEDARRELQLFRDAGHGEVVADA